MELKEFITTTLVQIAEGVSAARPVYEEKGGIINPKDFDESSSDLTVISRSSGAYKRPYTYSICNVEFEVSLTQDKNNKSSGGIGVLLGVVSVGGKTGLESGETSYSKIRFNVPVVLP